MPRRVLIRVSAAETGASGILLTSVRAVPFSCLVCLCLVLPGAIGEVAPPPCNQPQKNSAMLSREENRRGINLYRAWKRSRNPAKLEAALTHFQRAVEKDCGHVRSRLNFSGVLARLGRFAESTFQLSEARRQDAGTTWKVLQEDDDFQALVEAIEFKDSEIGKAYFEHLEKKGFQESILAFQRYSKQGNRTKIDRLARRLGQLGSRGTASLVSVVEKNPDRRLVQDTAQVFVQGRGMEGLEDTLALIQNHRTTSSRLLGLVTLRRYLVDYPASSSRIQSAIPKMIDGLRSPSADLRSMSCVTLADLGPHSKDAIPPLTLLLQDRDAHVRGCASYALRQIALPPK